MRILVAIDGSECSIRAAGFASKLASESNSTLAILHVIPKIETTKEDLIILLKEEIGDPKKAGEKYLDRAKEKAARQGIAPDLILREGNPADEILKEVEGFDLVVVGSHGKGAIDRILLGSISSKLVHRSTVPVMVVK
jgi:nucleotide-binding universal stress UspA family protein